MAFFPTDPKKYRPSKVIFNVDVLREVDRAVQEGIGGYTNRHELINDLVEQGLIDLRYPDGEEPVAPEAKTEAETASSKPSNNGHGDSPAVAEPAKTMPKIEPLSSLTETRMSAPEKRGAVIENKLAHAPEHPLFGMHNRDAPTAWALNRLAEVTPEDPVALGGFYEETTKEAWKLAAKLQALETKGRPKLAVMLPRNPEKPQSADEGFRAFALGVLARKADAGGQLAASGPFFEWHAVAAVGDPRSPEIGLTEIGWQLVEVFDGLDFSYPHDEDLAHRFLQHQRQHAAPDAWGFRTVLEGASGDAGRVELSEYFERRLGADFDGDWKLSVAESVASGYVSRAREWGLIEPKMRDSSYALTASGQKALDEFKAKA